MFMSQLFHPYYDENIVNTCDKIVLCFSGFQMIFKRFVKVYINKKLSLY